jgi:p-aminobenzoyl-glutamate transporter AbgT
MNSEAASNGTPRPSGFVERALDTIERVGNKLPDPAALFLLLLFVVWVLSALLSTMSFAEIDPRTGKALVINNQMTGTAIAAFLSNMVTTFTLLLCWVWAWPSTLGSSMPRSRACSALLPQAF